MKGKLQIKSHDGAIKILAISIYWQFQFFNYSVEAEKIHPFLDCVKNMSNGERISEIITNPQRRERLRCCYNSLHKTDFNNTSLLVLHGPVHNQGSIQSNREAQLLTGDINLKRHIPEIIRRFGSDLSDVGLCLIPHHGSKRNWDKAILPYVSRGCTWVVSTGKTNKSQPSSDILRDIKKQGQDYTICNDNSIVTFNIPRGLHTSTVIH